MGRIRAGFGGRGQGACAALFAFLALAAPQSAAAATGGQALRYYPAGPIYDYRWKLLELALAHAPEGAPTALAPYDDDVTQNRAVMLLEHGAIDVIALGTNADREARMRPVRVDILRGIVGYRVMVIRAADQARVAAMNEWDLRRQLTFGLNSQWADLEILRANGFAVVTSSRYESLFGMLAAGRFDAFTRGLNEADVELEARRARYPQLALERTKALYFPYPVYFWVARDREALAQRIQRGLQAALADGSFRALFLRCHAREIAMLARDRRQVVRLGSPILPAGAAAPDTQWWWRAGAGAAAAAAAP